MRQNNIDIKKIEEMFGNNVPSDRQEFFKYVLENIDTMDLLSLHNDYYCNYYGDDYIYDNDEYNFNEWMGDRTPYEVALTLKNSDWNHYDDFFKMDGTHIVRHYLECKGFSVPYHRFYGYLIKIFDAYKVPIKTDWVWKTK